MKRIAIVGAGWTGLGCLRTLKKYGHKVDVYEQRNNIGGTWHPDNCYAGLKIHAPAMTVEYPDFPFPSHIDRFERITSQQVFSYLKAYCVHYGLYQYITFNCHVKKISYDSRAKTSKIWMIDENGTQKISADYDFIIYTNGYSNKELPNLKDMDEFSGSIYHSFDVHDELLKEMILANKNITVLGASKTATDFILKFYDFGYKVTWLYRKSYWFFRFNLRSKWLKQENKNYFFKCVFLCGLFSAKISSKLTFRLWRLFNIVHTFGKKHYDFNRFHYGMIDDNQMRILKDYYKDNAIESGIKKLAKDGIILKDGRKIAADVIICCTGSGASQLGIDLEIDNQRFATDEIKNIYRSRVIPAIPNLIFTAYHQFSMGVVEGLLEGNWIAKYIELNPATPYLSCYATKFNEPFFSKQLLFNSSTNIINLTAKMYEPFFENKELSVIKFLQWFLDSHFDGSKPIQAFTFQLPTADRSADTVDIVDPRNFMQAQPWLHQDRDQNLDKNS